MLQLGLCDCAAGYACMVPSTGLQCLATGHISHCTCHTPLRDHLTRRPFQYSLHQRGQKMHDAHCWQSIHLLPALAKHTAADDYCMF